MSDLEKIIKFGAAAGAVAAVLYVAKQKFSKKGNFKVCVCGGAGGIGQPLSLLMAMDENVSQLCVQDVTMALVPAAGVAADLSHLEKKATVSAYSIDPKVPCVDQLKDCMTGCSLVLVPAGVPRKPGMTRDDLFGINAGIAKGIVDACAAYCPDAVVALIVNPVNSIVPAMAELYKKKGLDPKKIVGVTTLDCVRANKFVAQKMGVDPGDVEIPVIGGHAGATIMPVFSQDKYGAAIPASEVEALDKRVQDAGTEVVNAKDGKGSATLSMAYAGARLGKAVLAGLAGKPTTECAYVVSDGVSELPYFTTKVTFGKSGVEKVHPIGSLNEREMKRLAEATAQLKGEIETGLKYAAGI
jgi:malate dehydrogenase